MPADRTARSTALGLTLARRRYVSELASGLECVLDRSEMPFLRLPVDLTQELLPRLRIPTATLLLIKLFDFVVNHAIDNLAYKRANASSNR